MAGARIGIEADLARLRPAQDGAGGERQPDPGAPAASGAPCVPGVAGVPGATCVPGATGAPAAPGDPRGMVRLVGSLWAHAPYDVPGTLATLVAHAVPGRDRFVGAGEADGAVAASEHAIGVPSGTAVARLDWVAAGADAEAGFGIPILLDLPAAPGPDCGSDARHAIAALRRFLDLDAEPAGISAVLGGHPRLSALVARRPGLRVPGARDPAEFALGVVLGQQVSLAAARTLQGRLAARFARAGTRERSGPGDAGGSYGLRAFVGPSHSRVPVGPPHTHVPVAPPDPHVPVAPPYFLAAPDPAAIAALPEEELRAVLGITGARAATLRALAAALAAGLDLGPDGDPELARSELAAIRGIGPWTVEVIAMRGLRDADACPAGDLILRRALGGTTPRQVSALAEAWRPFRAYATQHLWSAFLADRAAR